jgi:hypothetical protein
MGWVWVDSHQPPETQTGVVAIGIGTAFFVISIIEVIFPGLFKPRTDKPAN